MRTTTKTKAKVLWFDRSSGYGSIQTLDTNEHLMRIHASSIPGSKSWWDFHACVYYTDRQIIDVEYFVDEYECSVTGITPGHFDAEQYNNLPKDRSFAVSDGVLQCGLFNLEGK